MGRNPLNSVKLNEEARTPQTQKAAKGQKQNAAGGWNFKVSDEDRFRRFLTIGSTGGTYYISEKDLTDEQVKFVQKHIEKAGVKAVDEIVNVSDNGLAPRNTQALFALAIAFKSDDLKVKAAAKAALPKVARTSTHLFEFVQYIENTSGWGRAKTQAVAAWYTDKTVDQLAYQVTKYRSRTV
jgi:60 kDa SS-A/Ro ribonucleoprotein